MLMRLLLQPPLARSPKCLCPQPPRHAVAPAPVSCPPSDRHTAPATRAARASPPVFEARLPLFSVLRSWLRANGPRKRGSREDCPANRGPEAAEAGPGGCGRTVKRRKVAPGRACTRSLRQRACCAERMKPKGSPPRIKTTRSSPTGSLKALQIRELLESR